MIRNVRVLAIALLMTFFLVHMISDRMTLLRDGKVIELSTAPVDPRSLFRGDYVILEYEISTIDILPLEGDTGFDTNDPVFITLGLDGENWTPVAAHKAIPKVGTNQVLIAGRVMWRQTSICSTIPETKQRECEDVEEMRITYGIESFFVPEGTGRELEKKRNDGRMRVRIAVDEKGRAGIKSLLIDGDVLYKETLF